MRLLSALRLLPPPLKSGRAWLAALLEVGTVGAGIVLLEAVGRFAIDDAADLVGAMVAGLLVALLVGAARSGRAPLTRQLARVTWRGLQRLWNRLSPQAGVAFRLPAEPAPLPYRPHRRLLLGLAAAIVLILALGARLPAAMTFIKHEVAYTPYLLLLVASWVLFGAVTVFGWVVVRSSLPAAAHAPGSVLGVFLVPLVLLWIVLLTALALLPGWVGMVLVLVVGLGLGARALTPPPGTYYLWRLRLDERVEACTIHQYLVGTWLVTLLGALLVVALAAGPRLLSPLDAGGAYGLTQGLGLAATASCLILVVRAGRLIRRLIPRPADAPEQPLVRTVWAPDGVDEAFLETAATCDFQVPTGDVPPEGGYDLVVGRPGDPARFVPRLEGREVDRAFHLRRRFHIRKRRVFFRRFHRLHKQVAALRAVDGAGFLFCPHAWPLTSIVGEGVDAADGTGRTVLGGRHVGRPFADAFPLRVRSYMHEVLGALDIDAIYWDARIAWPTLKMVFRVLFETYDQGRHPALDRHFIGLPRVRVLIQEPEDVDGGSGRTPGQTTEAPPLRARILLIRRDDGGREVEDEAPAPSSRRPEPILA